MKKILILFILINVSFILNAQTFQWAKSFGSFENDSGSSIIIDKLGNLYLTGCYTGVVDFNDGTEINELTSKGECDIYILKLDSNGSFIWARSIGSVIGDG